MARLFVMRERDVGLFSLVQQVISNLPRAEAMALHPLALFGAGCVYYTAAGHRDRDTVWEYYFEPLDPAHPASALAGPRRDELMAERVDHESPGRWLNQDHYLTNNFGDHPDIADRTIPVLRAWVDPDVVTRRRAAALIERYVRPRAELAARARAFGEAVLSGGPVLGLHIRGTDAVAPEEEAPDRIGMLKMRRFVTLAEGHLDAHPEGRVLVASDAQRSVDQLRNRLGPRAVALDAVRHDYGPTVGRGPEQGRIPDFLARDARAAAQNGEDAVVEYLLLRRCRLLGHNGASLARTVRLAEPDLAHVNLHRPVRAVSRARAAGRRQTNRVRRVMGVHR